MTAKNKPTYELFCKGIMNKSRKGVRFDADGNVIVEPKAEFGSDVEVDGQLTINSASDLKTKDGTTFKGDAGVGIEAVSLTDAKGLDFTMTDGTHLYTHSVQGPKGDTGATGPQGPKGDTGPAGATPDLSNYATKAELNAKQATLYRHTVLILNTIQECCILSFSAESENNLKIDSFQDLITVFGNTTIACSGVFNDNDEANASIYLLIEIGTGIADTRIYRFPLTAGSEISEGYITFSDAFGESAFTITDTVTAM